MIGGTKPMKMAVKSAMKMKAAKAMKLKEEAAMKKKAMPDFPDVDGDGNTTESIKSATASVKKTPKQLKEAAMKLKEEKTPMKADIPEVTVKPKKFFASKPKPDATGKYTTDFMHKGNLIPLTVKNLEQANYFAPGLSQSEKNQAIKELKSSSSAPKMKKDAAMKLKEKPMKMKKGEAMKLKEEKAAMKMGHSPKKMGHKK